MDALPLRIVFDTNVLVSLLVFKDVRFAGLDRAWRTGALVALSDDALREELNRVLHYPQFIRRRPPAEGLGEYDELVVAASAAEGRIAVCRDPDDQKFLQLAAGGQAAVLLTDDKQLLRMNKSVGFQIETPLRFQRRWCNGEATGS